MRPLFLAGLIILPWLASCSAGFASSDCNLIRDRDRQRMCYALTERSASECNLIRNDDERRICRARTERR